LKTSKGSTELVVSLGKGKHKATSLNVFSSLPPNFYMTQSYRSFIHSEARRAVDMVLDMWAQKRAKGKKPKPAR
jgi:hypothetical protein